MLTRRGFAVLGAGLLLWIDARLTGAQDLHIVALGLLLLPVGAAVFLRWTPHHLRARRRLALRRVASGSPLRVDVEVENRGRSAVPLVLLEDRLPAALGRAARAVLGGMKPRARQTVSYTLHCGRRGRYQIGPLVAAVTDPFGLAQRRHEFPELHELIVYPEVEDLRMTPGVRSAGGSGETTARQLFRTGEEFYGMRQYQIGDDLRRIHWPSTARMGKVMIRQDEAGRRAAATVFLDTRRPAYHASEEAFERAVSAAASAGSLYLRGGVAVQLATTDLAPTLVTPESFLESLAIVQPSDEPGLAASLVPLRDRSRQGATLILVTTVPRGDDVTAILQATGAFGQKTAALIDRGSDPEQLREIRLRLARGEWRTIVLPLDQRLKDLWTLGTQRPIAAAASS